MFGAVQNTAIFPDVQKTPQRSDLMVVSTALSCVE
jgi:hypothetical protein